MILKAVVLLLIPVSLAVEQESSYPLVGLLEKCQSKNYELQEKLSEVQSQLYEVNLNSQKKDVELQSLKAQIAQLAAVITRLHNRTSDEATNATQSHSTQVENLPDRCPSTQEYVFVHPVIKFPGLEPFEANCYANNFWIGSGWMEVYSKNIDSTDFNRTYDDYINGFKGGSKTHFIGLEKLHIFTSRKPHEVVLYNYDSSEYTFRCENFVVGDRSEGYSLKRLDGCSGDNWVFNITQGSKFSAFDRDEDGNWGHNWAQELGLGFWFNAGEPHLGSTGNLYLFIRRKD